MKNPISSGVAIRVKADTKTLFERGRATGLRIAKKVWLAWRKIHPRRAEDRRLSCSKIMRFDTFTPDPFE